MPTATMCMHYFHGFRNYLIIFEFKANGTVTDPVVERLCREHPYVWAIYDTYDIFVRDLYSWTLGQYSYFSLLKLVIIKKR